MASSISTSGIDEHLSSSICVGDVLRCLFEGETVWGRVMEASNTQIQLELFSTGQTVGVSADQCQPIRMSPAAQAIISRTFEPGKSVRKDVMVYFCHAIENLNLDLYPKSITENDRNKVLFHLVMAMQ